MSPQDSKLPAGAYRWAYPGFALRVLLSLDAVDRLQREICAHATSHREVGGLLIGGKDPGVTRIVEFIPLPVEPASGDPRFVLSKQWLEEVIARCPSDSKVVGYYRTSTEQLIRLREDDLALMRERFSDIADVCLVLAPPQASRINAAFFVWQHRSLAVNPCQTFPLSVEELVSSRWPIETEEPWNRRVYQFLTRFGASLLRAGEASVATKVGVIAAVMAIAVILLAGRLVSPSGSPPGLGLQVHANGTKFSLTWNRAALPIKDATEANLVIWDPSRTDTDGSSDPIVLPVPVERLHSGSMSYTSFRPIGKIRFRLDVTQASGGVRSEDVTSTAPDLAANEAMPIAGPARPEPLTSPHVQVISDELTGPSGWNQPGLITITSEPSGADVQIDSRPAGRTPVTIRITPVGRSFTVTVTKNGYLNWTLHTSAIDDAYSLHAQLRKTL